MALAEIPDPAAEQCLRDILANPETDPLSRETVDASLSRMIGQR